MHSFLLQKVKEMIFKDIVRIGKEAGLKTFEQVQAMNNFFLLEKKEQKVRIFNNLKCILTLLEA